MDDRLLMIVLRLVHILAGLFWVGAMLVVAGFLQPVAREGPEGGRVLQQVMLRHRLVTWLSAAAALTLLSGLWMYGRVAMATNGTWTRSRPGIAFGVGGLLAITAAGLAGAVLSPGGRRLAALGAQLQQSGGAPSAPEAAEMRRLQARVRTTTRMVAALLVLTAATMAIARYL